MKARLAQLRPTAGELREMLRLATPIVLAQLGIMLMGIVDTAMVGRVSTAAIVDGKKFPAGYPAPPPA